MKKIIFILLALAGSAVGFAQKKHVTFEAKIENRNGEKIYILGANKYKKEISVNKQGFFKDTLKVADGMYRLNDGVEMTTLYLKSGYDLKLKMNAQEFDESIVYTGTGANENNFLAKTALHEEMFNYEGALAANETEFKTLIEDKKKTDIARLEKEKLDPDFVKLQKETIDFNLNELKAFYNDNLSIKKLNNTVSPSFDYVNFKGGKTKLEDLRGKYVYIDVWATWCGPCRAEIPHLKKIEEKYHNKKIEFVSISVDTKKDYEKWKKFVTEKELGGIQLFADSDWNSQFIKEYNINGIPRFILIDPQGKIVNANADRPSSPRLVEVLDGLLN